MTSIGRVLLLENDILHDGYIGGRDRFSNSSLFRYHIGLIDLEHFTYEEAYDATLRIGSAIRGRGVNPAAMRKAEAAGSTECPVKIKLVAPPSYVLITQTLDKRMLLQSPLIALAGRVVEEEGSCEFLVQQHRASCFCL
ncbi:hypothetical protein AgCh_021185 [Apium graveolens]